jgi:hypothetical protein
MKTSEWKALQGLGPAVRARCRPLLEFVPEWRAPAPNQLGKRKSRSPQTAKAYVQLMIQRAFEATPIGTESFVDFAHAGAQGTFQSVHVWEEFENAVSTMSGRVIPVIAPDPSASIRDRVRRILARGHGQLAVRVSNAFVRNPAASVQLKALADAMAVATSSIHLLIDFKDQPDSITHDAIRASVGQTAKFASITVVAGVFPVNLMKYSSQKVVHLESRTEWTTWWTNRLATPNDQEIVGFGDYTTQHANYSEQPALPGSVSLRYTTDACIVVFRGMQADKTAGRGYEQIHGHCRLLIQRPDYAVATFSRGDQRMYCWTDPRNGTGNPEQWRVACVSHHITHTVAQLADATGSAEALRQYARARPPGTCG